MRAKNLHVVSDYFVYEIVARQSLGAVVPVAAPGKDDWLQLYAVSYYSISGVCLFLSNVV